eukprot:354318-Chlamydomonas_euryale.AAC.7
MDSRSLSAIGERELSPPIAARAVEAHAERFRDSSTGAMAASCMISLSSPSSIDRPDFPPVAVVRTNRGDVSDGTDALPPPPPRGVLGWLKKPSRAGAPMAGGVTGRMSGEWPQLSRELGAGSMSALPALAPRRGVSGMAKLSRTRLLLCGSPSPASHACTNAS